MSRYDPLRVYLAKIPADQNEVRLSFPDLEEIVGTLPPSARNYRPWWANSATMPQAAAWQQAGFVVEAVNLTAELIVFVRGRAQRRPAGGPLVASAIPEPDNAHARHGPPSADREDQTEAVVQARLVSYLAREQWHIHRVADTASREQGIDILATKAGRTLAIEVKGYPARQYADPRRADQVKPTNPSVQARHWYAAALLKATLTRDEHPTYEIAVAFPDVPTYRSLQQRTHASLADLAIVALFVAADGTVTRIPNEH